MSKSPPPGAFFVLAPLSHAADLPLPLIRIRHSTMHGKRWYRALSVRQSLVAQRAIGGFLAFVISQKPPPPPPESPPPKGACPHKTQFPFLSTPPLNAFIFNLFAL